jgi:hypothetical protein
MDALFESVNIVSYFEWRYAGWEGGWQRGLVLPEKMADKNGQVIGIESGEEGFFKTNEGRILILPTPIDLSFRRHFGHVKAWHECRLLIAKQICASGRGDRPILFWNVFPAFHRLN